MSAREFKPGDRVRDVQGDRGTILAIHSGRAWVDFDHIDSSFTRPLARLTPLPPPEPEPDAIDRAILAFLPQEVFADQRTHLRALADAILDEADRRAAARLEPAAIFEADDEGMGLFRTFSAAILEEVDRRIVAALEPAALSEAMAARYEVLGLSQSAQKCREYAAEIRAQQTT